MPQQTEPSANNALGELLAKMLPGSVVRSEHTQVIVDHAARQPDILVTSSGRSPVVVEAEYMPAYNAESEAKDRLGLEVAGTARHIDAAIALRYPAHIKNAYDLPPAISDAHLSYCVLYYDGTRFPESGWLDGSVEDLSDLIRLVSVPQRAVDQAADALEKGIDRAASILQQLARSRPGVVATIAERLGMSEAVQTYRMAGAIVANAMVFHERLAGMHNVSPLSQLCSTQASSPKANILDAWTEILKINYWPIFAIARDIVEQLPAAEASQMLTGLRTTVEDVEATGANQAHDLTGRIFQRLIADRKYLATFYTLPASAALLARLAVAKLCPEPDEGIDFDWSDPNAISNLRIADFACGTGALLSAVYEQIATRHERAGGDLEALHPVMMEKVLYGCDVMPSAIHITGSTLSGAQPTVGFGNTRLYNLAYGRQEDGSVRIGSLELLQSSSARTLFNTSDPAMRTGSVGEETAAQIIADIPDEGFDLVIMNPPFTRNTNKEGAYANTFAAAFAAFNANTQDQKEMAKRMSALKKGTCYHGHAGMASAFAALAHRKLKVGGVLALVLPLSAASGFAWLRFREMLGLYYSDLKVLSIAANGKDMSFSSDTGMAECLVVAFKGKERGLPSSRRAHFTSLRHRPHDFAEASAIVRSTIASDEIRQIEDGPYGGTVLTIGDEIVGEMLSIPHMEQGQNWGPVRLRDYSLVQAAYSLSRSKLLPPGSQVPLEINVNSLNHIARLGFHHLDITGLPSTGIPQGPFSKISFTKTATYPCLWNHNAKNETHIICDPDSQLIVRQGMEAKAATVWATASHTHLNLEFTFGSQPLAVAFTERESIGGRVWPNVIFGDKRFDYAFAVWGNSTLGLLSHWWHSSRQQSSKAGMTIRSAESLPILDFQTLTDDQLSTAQQIFDDFRHRDLMPAYLADADPNRALLDRRVICDLLNFDQDTYQAVRRLSAKWCAEPSVHGGKKRPPAATLVI